MKNIKQFNEFTNEAYDEAKHKNINAIRKVSNTKIFHKISKLFSIIDDLKRLDFRALIHSLKNKSGFNKLEKAMGELGLLKKLKEEDDNFSFQDLYRYNFDSELILRYLNDEDVLDYLEHDSNIKYKLEELDDLILFLEEYDDWKKSLLKGMK